MEDSRSLCVLRRWRQRWNVQQVPGMGICNYSSCFKRNGHAFHHHDNHATHTLRSNTSRDVDSGRDKDNGTDTRIGTNQTHASQTRHPLTRGTRKTWRQGGRSTTLRIGAGVRQTPAPTQTSGLHRNTSPDEAQTPCKDDGDNASKSTTENK